MKHEVKDFIYHAENAVPKEVCNIWIEQMEKHMSIAEGKNGLLLENVENANSVYRQDLQLYCPPHCPDVYAQVKDVVMSNFQTYAESVNILKSSKMLFFTIMKAQKTPAGSVGFSNFHIEQSPGTNATRSLTWMIYLNDVEEGGSTEFPYQKQVFQPKAGSLLLWPAGYTHPHRGNPVYSNDKYIFTGWFEFPFFPYDKALGGS